MILRAPGYRQIVILVFEAPVGHTCKFLVSYGKVVGAEDDWAYVRILGGDCRNAYLELWEGRTWWAYYTPELYRVVKACF